MADGYFSRRRGSFKAYLTVQANPGNVVTVTGSRTTYTGTADGTTGIATFEIKKKDVYTITTNSGANSEAEGNTPTVNVNKTGSRFNGQMVKITVPTSLTVANYSSNALTAYWGRPGANWSGSNLRRSTTSAPTSRTAGDNIYSGVGNADIVVNASTTVNGYTNTGLTANTLYYYSLFSYLTINGTTYWSTTYRTGSATAANYVGNSVTLKITQTWTAPTGWRSIQIFGVGGGGGGAGGQVMARGGGGGGRTSTSGSISVTPGKAYAVEVGTGGAGGESGGAADDPKHGGKSGGATKLSDGNTTLFSVGGGDGGWYYRTSAEGYSGGWGGSGGGAQGYYENGSSLNRDGAKGGSDGSNGGNVQGSRDGHMWWGGEGQKSTTRAWRLSNGTLYAGGGGGGSRGNNYSGGAGGDGGGGRGGTASTGYNGTANTGGGGGGGADSYAGGSGGSGIMLIKCIA